VGSRDDADRLAQPYGQAPGRPAPGGTRRHDLRPIDVIEVGKPSNGLQQLDKR